MTKKYISYNFDRNVRCKIREDENVGFYLIVYNGDSKNSFADMLIPQPLSNAIMGLMNPSAVTLGVSGSLPIPKIRILGLMGGAEVLWSPHTKRAALYALGGVNLSTATGSSASASLGLVYDSPTSNNYQGPFLGIHLPTFKALPPKLKGKIIGQMMMRSSYLTDYTNYLADAFDPVLYNQMQLHKFSKVLSLLDKVSVNLFSGPNFSKDAKGFSLSIGNSDAHLATSATLYSQLYPGISVPFDQNAEKGDSSSLHDVIKNYFQ